MSPPGRPKGEYRSAQHEGALVSTSFSLENTMDIPSNMHASSNMLSAPELTHEPALSTIAPGVARISSAQLLRGANEVQIEHHGVLYRLKQTSLGKLILTK
jgi:hemin uptake protein HemP